MSTKILADILAGETDAALRARRLNAQRILLEGPLTPRGAEAERYLAAIQLELENRHLPGMIRQFLEGAPLGFSDPEYLRRERNDKLAASTFCRQRLTPDAFSSVSSGGKTDFLLADVKAALTMTNLIELRFERPDLLRKIDDPKNTKTYLEALGRSLDSQVDPSERLERFNDDLEPMGLKKWTYASYFLFLMEPDRCMFVKPTSIKLAAEIAQYPIEYEATPSAKVYRQILRFSEWLKGRLEQQSRPELSPRDMIDVQGFIWHMAPTGIHAR